MFLVYVAVIALAWGIRQAGGLELESFFKLIDEYPVFAPVLLVIAYGIQLPEETAIGQYPMECLDVVPRIIREIDSEIK